LALSDQVAAAFAFNVFDDKKRPEILLYFNSMLHYTLTG